METGFPGLLVSAPGADVAVILIALAVLFGAGAAMRKLRKGWQEAAQAAETAPDSQALDGSVDFSDLSGVRVSEPASKARVSEPAAKV